MRSTALEVLACPACSGRLGLLSGDPTADGHILEGQLECAECNRRWPIRRGIPRLLHGTIEASTKTAQRFSDEWKVFDEIRDYHRQQFLDWIAPLTSEDFRGQTVLEAGCGKGRHSRLLGGWSDQVVSIDLGDAVEVAFANTRDLTNVHVVQTDLLRPGVARNFDVVICVGVLHHLPEPSEGFRSLIGHLRPGGRIATWTYGRENNGWIVYLVDPIRKRLTSRLPTSVLLVLSTLLTLPVWVLARIARTLRKRGVQVPYEYLSYVGDFPFAELKSIVFDQLTPPISHYLPRAEVERWYRDAHLESVQTAWHNSNSWRATAVKSI